MKINSNYGNNITLKNVLYVPDLRLNLMSVSKITDHNFKVTFTKKEATITNKRNEIVAKAIKTNGLYEMMEKYNNQVNLVNISNVIHLWHQRFGHLNFKTLVEMVKNQKVKGVKVTDLKNYNPTCEICIQGKQSRRPFSSKNSRSNTPLELIHSDVCGPIHTKSEGGAQYIITFIDDFTRWAEVYMMKQKNEALDCFKKYKAKVENYTGRKIKCLRTDNGREYINENFSKFLENSGIQHQLTAPYTPQQNGVAERYNRTLIEMARCMIIQSKLPTSLWTEAVATANHIRNRTSSSSLNGNTPDKLWKNSDPQVSYFKVFGSLAYRQLNT